MDGYLDISDISRLNRVIGFLFIITLSSNMSKEHFPFNIDYFSLFKMKIDKATSHETSTK